MRQTVPLLCRVHPLKINIYMYPFVVNRDTTFALDNTTSENQDIYVQFCYQTDTARTLQNIPFENQGFYVPFCYDTGHYLYLPEYAF